MNRLSKWICIAGLLILELSGHAFDFGPLLDQFPLTLAPGERLEVAGPLYYQQESDSERTRAVPPLFSSVRNPELDYQEFDILYPLLTYDRFGEQYRWQLFQLLSLAGGPTQVETERDRFTLFPIIFFQRSSDTNENYWAVAPLYGHLKNRFGRDEVFLVMWPGYVKTRKKDVHTWNYLFPFFHVRRGDELRGWQFWPLVGNEVKGVTYRTNNFGETNVIGGHKRQFALWPIYFNQYNGLGTTNSEHAHGVLPLYVFSRSPLRDSSSFLWPFFNIIEDRGKDYKEWQGPWPFVAFARGEGKQLNRVLPFYSHGKTPTHETRSYAWPIFRESRFRSDPVDRRRSRVLFFLYSDLLEKNTETGAVRKRIDLWPLFTHKKDFNGNTRLQVLAPLEPILANNKSIERNYSPLWSVWRQESNPREGASSQSLLWNLYRRETTPETKKTSLLFGLFRYVTGAEGKQVRLFYIPMGSSRANSVEAGEESPDMH